MEGGLVYVLGRGGEGGEGKEGDYDGEASGDCDAGDDYDEKRAMSPWKERHSP